jgi:hypothetical protein
VEGAEIRGCAREGGSGETGRREGAKREEECRGSAGEEGVAAAGLCEWQGEEGEEWCRDVGEGKDRWGQGRGGRKAGG